jgi:hypothetical protein
LLIAAIIEKARHALSLAVDVCDPFRVIQSIICTNGLQFGVDGVGDVLKFVRPGDAKDERNRGDGREQRLFHGRTPHSGWTAGAIRERSPNRKDLEHTPVHSD